MEKLLKYLDDNFIVYELSNNLIIINNERYRFEESNQLFDKDFHLQFAKVQTDYYIYMLGKRYYYTSDLINVEFNELKHIEGAFKGNHEYPFLGVHSGQELMNGSGSYGAWVKKAKFLGITQLGLCERSTMAGFLKFQHECLSQDVTPILGVTYMVKDGDIKASIKIYIRDKKGWENALLIHKQMHSSPSLLVEMDFIRDHNEGLLVVIDPKKSPFKIYDFIKFYQLDIPNYNSTERNKNYLQHLEKFIKSEMEPIYIQDAYYLDKDDAAIKPILNTIEGVHQDLASGSQYMKDVHSFLDDFLPLFDNAEKGFDIFESALNNLSTECSYIGFTVDETEKHFPNYVMSKEEAVIHASTEDLFFSLIEAKFDEVVKGDPDIYIDRLDKEISVIKKGGFIDYFLILWDVVDYCKRESILTGVGRGSAAGSLVAYILGITRVDPIEHNLLFERFLNEGRIKHSPPDIDIDFPGTKRDKIKHYLEDKYSEANVCSVGTYGTLQLRAAIQALSGYYKIPVKEYRYISGIIDTDFDGGMKDMFYNAFKKPSVLAFMNKYADMFHMLPLLLKQPRSQSIHASATIIVPVKSSVEEMIPAKQMLLKDGQYMMVSEWEGSELDSAGYLKEDLLGIRQLDKLQDMVNETGVDIYSIDLEDPKVYDYFARGLNSDVFHYGSKGLTKYSTQLQPRNFHDLSAGIALYRPGTMESKFHEEYILRKDFIKPITYYQGTEEITKDTFGLIIYQEQIMQICQKLADFNMDEADDIRRALGKKKQSVIDAYKYVFIDRAVANDYDPKKVEELWSIMEKFAKYSFNLSHSVAYAMTAYITQWMKVYHPITFWSTTFKYVFSDSKRDEKIPVFINELSYTSDISVEGVGINKSGLDIIIDRADQKIFWPLSAVVGLGEKALTQILTDRGKGPYESFNNFLNRHSYKGSKLNKTGFVNLIKSGAFDYIEGFEKPVERKQLLKEYFEEKSINFDQYEDVNEDWQWWLFQKQTSKFAKIPYKSIIDEYSDIPHYYETHSVEECLKLSQGELVACSGYVVDVIKKATKKGLHANIIIEANSVMMDVKLWQDSYSHFEDLVNKSKGNIIIISGSIKYDKYKNDNTITVSSNNEFKILSNG